MEVLGVTLRVRYGGKWARLGGRVPVAELQSRATVRSLGSRNWSSASRKKRH